MRRLALAAAAAAALFALAALSGVARPGAAHSVASADRTVTVNGDGVVNTVPTRADFSFGVVTQARTAAAALAANAAAAQKVSAALKAAGVAAADIQTQQVSIDPRFNQAGTAIVGYTATNSVSAAVRDLGRAGAVVDAAVAAGADQVSGPNLTRDDSSALYRQALAAAYTDARTKAQALAQQVGAPLGDAVAVSELGASTPQPLLATGKAGTTSTTIEPGTQQIEAQVTVTFALG
jgi:uncharacterized protein YggE